MSSSSSGSGEYEDRVIQLRFDNEQFEKGVAESTATLKKLNENLEKLNGKNFGESLNGLKEAIDKIPFFNMSDGIDEIKNKFSSLGTFGRGIILNLSNDIYRFGKGVLKTIINPLSGVNGILSLVSGGGFSDAMGQIRSGGVNRATNLENARFQLQGILGDAEKVEAIISGPVDYAVSGTRYGLDEAARVSAQMAASGITDLEKLKYSLRGISGAAAMTGREYSDIGNIFATVASNGKLMTMQLRQFSASGLNVAATLAKQLGKTENEINDLVSKGKIDFDTFAKAMDDAFGEHAKAANDTFEGALSNVKAAFSRIGEIFYTPFHKNMIPVLNEIRLLTNSVKAFIATNFGKYITQSFENMSEVLQGLISNPAFKSFLGSEHWGRVAYNAFQALENVFWGLLTVLKAIGVAWDNIFGGDQNEKINFIGDIAKGFNELTQKLFPTEKTVDAIISLFESLFAILKLVGSAISGVLKILSPILKPIGAFVGLVIRLISYLGKWVTSLSKGVGASKGFGKAVSAVANVIKRASDILANFFTHFEEIMSLLGQIVKIVLKPVSDSFKKFFDDTDKKLENSPISGLLKNVKELGQAIKTFDFAGIGKSIRGIFDSLKQLPVISTAISVLTRVLNVLKTVLLVAVGLVITIAPHVANLATLVGTKLVSAFQTLLAILALVVMKVAEFFGFLSSRIAANGGGLMGFVGTLGEGLTTIKNGIASLFSGGGEGKITSFFQDLGKRLQVFGGLFDFLVEKFKMVVSWLTPARVGFIALAAAIGVGFFSVLRMVNSFTAVNTAIKNVITGVTSLTNPFKKEKKESTIMTFAKAVAILAASLALLTILDNAKLINVVEIIGGILVAMAGFSIVMALIGKIFNGDKAKAIMVGMLAMSASLLLVIASMKLLEDINMNAIWERVGLIAVILLELVAAAKMIGGTGKKLVAEAILFYSFSKLIGNIADAIGKVSGLTNDQLRKSVIALSGVMIGLAIVAKSAGGIGVGTGIGLLAMVYLLKNIGPVLEDIGNRDYSGLVDKLRKAMDVIAQLGIMAVLIAVVTAKFGTGLIKFAVGLGFLAVALTLLIGVMKLFGALDPKSATRGTRFLLQMFAMFAVFELLSVFTKKAKFGSLIIGFTALSVAMLIVAGVIAIIGKFDPTAVSRGVKALAVLMGMYAVVAIASRFSRKTGSIVATMALLLEIAGILVILSHYDWKSFGPIAKAISTTMLSIAGAIFLMGVVNKGFFSNFSNLIPVMGLILELGGIFAILSFMPWQGMLAGMVAMSATMIVFGVVTAALSAINITGKQVGKILGASLILLELAGAIFILALRPWANVIASAAAMSAVLIIFKNMLSELSSKTGLKLKKIGVFLLATLSLIPVAAALWTLASRPWESMLASAAAMSGVLFVFGNLLSTISSKSGIKVGKIADFLLATLSLVPIAAALFVLADKPWNGLISAATGLVGVVLALSIAMGALSESDVGLKKAGAFVIAAAALIPAAFAMSLLDGYDWKTIIAAALGLSAAVIAVSVAMNIIGTVGVGFGAVLGGAIALSVGLVAMIAIITFGFTAIIAGLGWLSDKWGEQIDSGLEFLKKICVSVAERIGEAIASLITNISGSFPQLGQDLSDFWKNASGFFEGIKSIDADTLTAAGYATDVIMKIAGAELLSAASDFLSSIFGNSDSGSFGEKLVAFGGYLVSFGETIEDLDSDAVEKASNAASMIIAFAQEVPNSGGLLGMIVGENDLDKFGETLEPLANGLVAFSSITKGNIDENAVSAAANAMEMIIAFAKEVPNSGGWLAEILGDNTLDDFGNQLKPLALGLVAFSSITKGNIDTSAVEAAANAMDMIIAFAKEVPNSGGWLADFLGDNRLDDFGDQLKPLAIGLVAFSQITKGMIDGNAVQAASDAMDMIIKFAQEVPNSGGFISYIIGDNKLDDFGTQLKGLAEGLVGFAKELTDNGFDSQAVTAASPAIDMLVRLANGIPSTGGLFSFLTEHKTSLGEFGKQLKDLASGLVDFSNELTKDKNNFDIDATTKAGNVIAALAKIDVSAFTGKDFDSFKTGIAELGAGIRSFKIGEFDSTKVEPAVEALNSLTGIVYRLSTTDTSGVNDFVTAIGTLSGDFLSNFVTSLTSEEAGMSVDSAVTTLIGYFTTSITNQQVSIETAGSGVLGSFIAGFNTTMATDCLAAGSDAAQGIIDGINARLADLNLTGSGMAASVLEGISVTAGWNSPWEETVRAGGDAAQGIINGAAEKASEVTQSGTDMVTGFINGLAEASGWDLGGNMQSTADAGQAALNSFVSMVSGGNAELFGAGNGMAGAFGNGLTSGLSSVFSQVAPMVNQIKGLLSGTGVGGLQSTAKNWFKNKFGKPFKDLKDEFGNLKDEITGATEALGDFGSAAGGGGGGGGASKAEEKIKSLGETLKETITSQMDIFSEFEKKTDLTADKLLKNMRSQVQGVAEWSGNITKLAAKGIDQGLLKKLAEMGPKGYEYVNAFMNMSEDQLAEASELYTASLAMPDVASKYIEDGFANAGLMATEGFADNIDPHAGDANAQAMGQNAVDAVDEGAGVASPSWKTRLTALYMGAGLVKGFAGCEPEVVNRAKLLATNTIEAIKEILDKEEALLIGKYFAQGLAEGIKNNSSFAIDAVKSLAKDMIKTTKATLDEKSPSKEAIEIAKFFDLGLAKGISKYAKNVVGESEDVSELMIASFKSSISHITDILNGTLDTAPTIRPVLDLTNVRAGASEMNGLLTSTQAFYVSNGMQRNNTSMSDDIARAVTDILKQWKDRDDNNEGLGGITVNVYGAPGQDVNELADAVSARLTNTIQRRKAVYA